MPERQSPWGALRRRMHSRNTKGGRK
jgi:hypothetical protein